MLEKLTSIEAKYNDINALLARPEVLSNAQDYQKYSKEQSDLQPIYEKFSSTRRSSKIWRLPKRCSRGLTAISRNLPWKELEDLRKQRPAVEDELKIMLLPKDPRDDRNVILEIMGGHRRDEAALFGAALFSACIQNMPNRDAGKSRLSTPTDRNRRTQGSGGEYYWQGAYSRLKYESVVHRVQRVPANRGFGPHSYVSGDCRGTARGRGS